MKYVYVISILDSAGRMESYRIVAANLSLATAKAQELAGVDATIEPSTTQNQGRIDSEVG
jgi:hypothetical protein